MNDRYIAVFCREVSGASVVVARKRFMADSVKEGLSWKGRTHMLDLSKPVYRQGRKVYYLIDMDQGQRVMGKSLSPVSPKLMDAILRKEIAKQLVSGLAVLQRDWVMIIVVLVLGILGGFLLGQVFHI